MDVRGFWQRHGPYLKRGVLPGLWFGFACLVANEMVGLVFGDWLYQVHGLRVQGLGLAAMAIGVGELLGEVVAMTAADPLGKRRVVAAGLVLNTLVALALPYARPFVLERPYVRVHAGDEAELARRLAALGEEA